jgi:RNA polymerase sigma factor (sigma-70 family)
MSYNEELIHNMKSNCKRRTCEAIVTLYARMKRGDDEARQQLIKSTMSIVVAKVDSYLQRYKNLEYLRDDLTSEGFLALIKIVNSMAAMQIEKPAVYIARSLLHAIGNAARQIADDLNETVSVLLEANYSNEIDLLDELDGACLTNLDHQLVELRHAGYTFHEMAEKTGLSRQSVQRDFDAIQKRFEKREKTLSN